MKHIISVPFALRQIEDYGADGFIKKLKQINADMVFFALDAYEANEDKRKRVFESLKRNVPLFQEAGFTVGVWVWAFMLRGDKKYEHITSPSGAVSLDQICPSDEGFCLFAEEYIKNIAASKPDIVLFDDDYRYGFLDCGLGCACKNHRKFMSGIVGEEIPLEGLNKKVWSGAGNKYRSAWLEANGYFFKKFARRIRGAIDSVDENIRLGLCACNTTWDFDGVSAIELAKIMAGKNKPFLRLIGAPYWAVNRNWGNRLQDVIELERMESSWCGDISGVDILSECDPFPRPRCACPSSFVEGFDMALRASGATNGTHKYILDCVSDTEYETGYIEKHNKNKDIYDKIEEVFSDKAPVGIRVYERMDKFKDMEVPKQLAGSDGVQNLFFSPAAKLLATQTIPSVYKGIGVIGIAFGENAKYLESGALSGGLILDVPAAKILLGSGVDVGLVSIGEETPADREYFPNDKNHINVMGNTGVNIAVKTSAEIQSYFLNGEDKFIGSYFYENGNGQKFLVYAVNAYFMSELFFKQRARGEQIIKTVERCGKKLPAKMPGNPDCYMLCKENKNGKAVWIGNFFSDECFNTTVVLDKKYSKVRFINCNGKLSGNEVKIEGIAPWSSVGFEVTL